MASKNSFFRHFDQNLLVFIVASVLILLGFAGALYGQGLIGAQLLGPAGPGSATGGKKDCTAEKKANDDAQAALADATAGYNNANARIQNALAQAVTWRKRVNDDNNTITAATKALADAETAYKNAISSGTSQDIAAASGKVSSAEAALGDAKQKLEKDKKILALTEANLQKVTADDGPKVAVAKQLLDDATAKSVAAAKALKACQQSVGKK